MKINYKRELEEAARSMILIHNPHTLIRMIVRMIVRKVKIRHAGILLYDKARNTYILTVSRGQSGLKIPTGFLRLENQSPLIRLFCQERAGLFSANNGVLLCEDIDKLIWKTSVLESDNALKDLIRHAQDEMERLRVTVCIPSYFQNILIGLLLLGEKTSGEKFYQEEIDFFTALASDVAMAVRNAQLFQELQSESRRAHDLFLSTTVALAAAVEAKDHYTHGHTERVATLSMAIAQRLMSTHKFSAQDLENLQLAALLHDIGKIGIPEAILNKVNKLTEEEMAIVREHPQRGVTILKPIRELKEALLGVKYHHERYDGKGYPEGLVGKDMPVIASIISVVDAFDAMITDRPYRSARSINDAMEELKRCSGAQFDPAVVEAAVKLYEEGVLQEVIKNHKR